MIARQLPGVYGWIDRCRGAMADHQIGAVDIDRLCRKGSVTSVEGQRDELWRVEGADLDGRSIGAVMALVEEESATVVKVIAVMAL